MKALRHIIIGAAAFLIWAAPVFAKSWRGITPLRSTRADVERLLGAPEPGSQGVFKTPNEVVRVTYANIECDFGWKVKPNTVVSLLVQPLTPTKLTELKLETTKYEKRRDLNLTNVYYYISAKDGINYTVDEGPEVVTAVEYYPTTSDKRLKCPLKKPKTTKQPPKVSKPTFLNQS